MLRPVHLVLLLVTVVLVTAMEETLEESSRSEIEPSPKNVNDLDADASSWGYARPWRYGGGWRNGWDGWRGGGWGGGGWRGGGWGGRGWNGRSGWAW